MALLSPGQIFAERYRIERYLAKGGFGAVYVAEQLATELRVAIKILWPNVLQSAELVEKFKLEARIAGRVNSDHIVRVVDAGFDAATSGPFLVMELLDGNDLQTVVERTGPIAPERVALYLRQAASALDKAHGFRDRQGAPTPIIHRDLKPENLFLTFREDRTPHVKVLDFGIAKVLSSATKVSQQIKGTPLYMAFEQAGGGPISPATDVWALGLIAFFLLTGKSYWRAANIEGSSLTQLFGELLAHPIVPPSQRVAEMGWPPRFPPAFDAWFLRCVDRDQRSRFASAGEAATALHAALGFDVAALGPASLPAAGLPSAPAGGPASIPGRAESGGMAQSGAPSLGPGSASYPGATGGGSAARSIPPSRPLTSTSAVALASDSRAIPGRRSLVAPVLGAGVVLGLALGGAAWWARSSASARVAAPSSAASAAPEPAPPPTAPAPLVAPSAPLEPAAAEPAASTPSARPGKAPPRPSGQAKAAPAPLPTTQPTTAPTARPTNVYGER